jgi:calcium-dependent protein kinase
MGVCCAAHIYRKIPYQASLIPMSEISNKSRLESIHNYYKFIKVIGHGQFGTVREAIKLNSNDKAYAIKSILKEKVKKKYKLLKRELQSLCAIDHPNIIKLHEIYEDEKYMHLVMDICRGGDLYDYILDKGTLNEVEVMNIMKKIFSAVNHLHTLNICHRDLKPDNFLLVCKDAESEVKVADFGMSVRFCDEEMKTIVGTPYYLAPEIYMGSYGKECDNWSLGVIIYFLLSGEQPFKSKNAKDLLSNVLKGNYDFRGRKWDLISDDAKDLISKLLLVDPDERISISESLRHPWFHCNPQLVNLEIFSSLRSFKAHGKLWRELMKVFVMNLSEQEIKKLERDFRALDLECTGFITAENIQTAMTQSGYLVIGEEIQKLIGLVDCLGNGKLNYTQFLIATIDRKSTFEEESFWNSFKYFDIVNSNQKNQGKIQVDDLEYVLKKAGCYIKSVEIQEILQDFQLKAGDSMTYEQFKEVILCKHNIGFSPENSIDSANLLSSPVRRFSQKRLSSHRISSSMCSP